MHTDNPITNLNETPLDGETLLQRADGFLSVGDDEQARRYYEQAAVRDADAAAPYVGLGTIAMRQNRPQDAGLAFRVACRLDPGCARAYEGLGTVAQNEGDFEKAFAMYLKSLDLDTNNLAALLGLFQVSLQMGSFARIIHYLERYLDKHPEDCSVMFTLATLYIKEDRYQASRDMLLTIRQIAPANQDAENLLEEVEQHLA